MVLGTFCRIPKTEGVAKSVLLICWLSEGCRTSGETDDSAYANTGGNSHLGNIADRTSNQSALLAGCLADPLFGAFLPGGDVLVGMAVAA